MSSAPLPPRPIEKLLTAADLAALPTSLPSGDVCYELDNGKLVILAPPGANHGYRQAWIIYFLIALGQTQGHGLVYGSVGIFLRRNPDRVVGADAAFVLSASLPVKESPEDYLETIPELVVEVRSKNDTWREIADKNQEYFDAGVQLVWVIDDDARTVTSCQNGQPDWTFRETDTLTCHLIPGFSLPVSKLLVAV